MLLFVLQNSGNLRSLVLKGCSQIAGIGALGFNRDTKFSSKFRDLDVTGLQLCDTAIHWIAAGCKRIESLKVEDAKNISNEGWRGLAKLGAPVKLHVSGASQLTIEGVRDIFVPSAQGAQSGVGESLRELNFFRCESLTDEAVAIIAEQAPFVASLNLGGISSLTDESLVAISRHCTQLERLDLMSCISDISRRSN